MAFSSQNKQVVSIFNLFTLVASFQLFGLTQDQEVEQRIQKFYQNKGDMNQPIPKYNAKTGERAPENRKLKAQQDLGSALKNLAGQKASTQYEEQYCRQVLDKKFPELKCNSPEGRAAARAKDKLEDLTKTWLNNPTHELSKIPTSGKTTLKLWSDDYWRLQYGATSYRYSTGKQFPNYRTAIADYSQPNEWNSAFKVMDLKRLSQEVIRWSPAEKYDVSVGDFKFSLTNEQKEEGQNQIGPNGDVEFWMGICHGWAAAAIVVPYPSKPVQVVGTEGVKVTWYPADIRSMASLAFANGWSNSNFIGGRCNSKKASIHPNGRIKDQECFDNNPSTFHLALGNMIGIQKNASFVMDKSFDYEVWNQPIQAYEFTYFNPLKTNSRSKNWEEVAVSYNDTFKKADRFQNPMTRGTYNEGTGRYNDSKIKKVVGVIAKVIYLAEISPSASEKADESNFQTETYTYDIEMEQSAGKWIATGGEWHQNSHPDFLWVPTKGAVAKTNMDRTNIAYEGKTDPSKVEDLTETAQSASRSGSPLCTVVSHLVRQSSGVKNYLCGGR